MSWEVSVVVSVFAVISLHLLVLLCREWSRALLLLYACLLVC